MSKVKTAIFGKDLRVELKDHELSASGNKIDIVSSGEGYFMPEIGPTNFLDWPSYKRYLLFGPRTYKRVFFALKKSAKCVDFGTENGIVYGPDEEQLKRALASTNLDKLGKQEPPFPAWIIYLILLTVIGIAAKVFGVIV